MNAPVSSDLPPSVNFWRIFGILQEVVKQSRQKRYYVYLICKITHGSPSCGISLLIFNLKYLKSFAALTPKMSSWTGEGITKWNTWFADHRTKYSLSLSRKTVLLAAIWPEINVDDCLINEWMLTMFAVPSFWLYRKNFQRILQKQGMKFKLNTMVTSKLMSHHTFIVWENYLNV